MRLFVLLMAVLVAAPAFAAPEKGGAGLPPLPAPIKQLEQDGAQLRYLGRDLGYDGWIAIKNGQEQYFYVTPDGSAFFLGVLFNKNGRAITFDQMKRIQGTNDPALGNLENAPSQKAGTPVSLAAAPVSSVTAAKASSGSLSEQLFAEVTAAKGFRVGKEGAPLIYTFIDPMCPHCKELVKALAPALDKGTIAMQVVPVGALTPQSRPMAANLMASPDAPTRLIRLMQGDHTAVPETMQANANAAIADIDANLAILMKWKFTGTPITVYRAKSGEIKLLKGNVANPELILKDLL